MANHKKLENKRKMASFMLDPRFIALLEEIKETEKKSFSNIIQDTVCEAYGVDLDNLQPVKQSSTLSTPAISQKPEKPDKTEEWLKYTDDLKKKGILPISFDEFKKL